jgi:hypothetical protein
MSAIMKKILFCISFVLIILTGKSQEIKFSANVSKRQLVVGERFQLQYSINSSASGFSGPDLSSFDVYSGPNQSSSIQIVNGNYSQALTYSFILAPKKEGKFTIGAASIVVGNGRVKSNAVDIEVLKGNAANKQQGGNQGNQGGNSAKGGAVNAGDNLFIRAIVDKNKAYLGEQITVTYKIYSKYNQISFSDLKFPTFNGYYSEEIKSIKNDKLVTENYNGSNYYTAELKKTLLFPQKSGKLEVPSLDATCLVREKVQSQSIFDQFFGGSYRDVEVKVRSKTLQLEILTHPASGKPSDFNGAVGSFSISAKTDKTALKAGDAVNYKITLSGKGNLKLLENLPIQFPSEFEVYDPQINDEISVTEGGMSGKRTFEYLMIPRAGGSYAVGPFTFSYFDPNKSVYQTITIPKIQLEVEKTSGDQIVVNRGGSQTGVKKLASDIRFIKTSNPDLKPIQSNHFFGSAGFYSLMSFPPLALIVLLIVRRRSAERSNNIGIYRRKEAGSMAQKRLKKAKELLVANNKLAYYEEVYKALNGYLSDKLQMPVAELSKDAIKAKLAHHKVQEEIVLSLLKIIDSCEFARYAPGGTSEMEDLYTDTIQVLNKIDQQLKA